MNQPRQITIAMVDDSEADRYICARLVRETFPSACFVELHDGIDAEHYLRAGDANSPARRYPPDLMLVDLNMPLLDGFKLLERNSATLSTGNRGKPIVVMVLSTSNRRDDRERALAQPGVVDYLLKDELSAEYLANKVSAHLDVAHH